MPKSIKIDVVKLNASGNTTAIVLSPLAKKNYIAIAKRLMQDTYLACEQVGFLERHAQQTLPHLHMMGGEFCANASRSLAVWLSTQHDDHSDQIDVRTHHIAMTVSGADAPLSIRVKDSSLRHKKQAEITMPLPIQTNDYISVDHYGDVPIVRFKGILHVIVYRQSADIALFHAVKAKLDRLYPKLDALGVMFYDQSNHAMTPLVYVYQTNSLIWEQSCGSGSVAVGCHLATHAKQSIDALSIAQPGGELTVSIAWQDGIVNAKLSGSVDVIAESVVYIDVSSET